MNRLRISLVGVLGLFLASSRAVWADGFLWLGSEFQGEGTIYRYNITTGVIDLTRTPTLPGGGSHWNNMATDGVSLYLGTPTTQYLGVADIYTGIVSTSFTYSPSLSGHKEDGAFKASTGNLWRVTFSGLLHETTTSGVQVNTYSGVGNLVGLEWVGETLYGTNYKPGAIGVINITGPTTATFTAIPWTAGGSPAGSTAALAYDGQTAVLYLTTSTSRLYSVSFANGMATAVLVVNLATVGYPSGGLVDGMGWVAPQCASGLVEITGHPQDLAVSAGSAATFNVSATGDPPLTYQWRKNGGNLTDGGNISGALSPSLSIDPVGIGDAGDYDCMVSNDCGSLDSNDATLTVGTAGNTAGYLWLGAEYSGEGNIYRYNIATGVIDLPRAVPLPPGAEHWNNMATDGAQLYLGNPNTQFMGFADPYSGAQTSSTSYSPSLAGRFEDGASHPATGCLWRITFDGDLYEMTPGGLLVNTYSIPGGHVGVEWVGDALYSTNFGGADIGRLDLGGGSATYTVLPWVSGEAPSGSTAALAYDAQNDDLYLATSDGGLYTVTIAGGMASAALVVDLNTVGYPEGGLVDGMGWVGPPCSLDFDADGDVDLADYNALRDCLAGPDAGFSAPSCFCFDADDDADVDLKDFAGLQASFTG